jgi:hypothetical protein
MHEPEWFFLPHARFDGLGGLAHVLRNTFRREIVLPSSKERTPSWLARVVAAVRCLVRRYPRPMLWREEDARWEASSVERAAPTAFAWALLSEEETSAVREHARARGVSLNAWLLHGLTQATLPRLVPNSGLIEWIVPLNMRGTVTTAHDTANAAWTVDVVFEPAAEPRAVDAAIRRQVERRAHWGAFQLMSLLRYLRPSVLRDVAGREMLVRKHGCFSNMGMLGAADDASGAPREWWMAFNPVLRSRPVGAACLTWERRLALTLQLHPALARDPVVARTWLDDWTGRALETRETFARCLQGG